MHATTWLNPENILQSKKFKKIFKKSQIYGTANPGQPQSDEALEKEAHGDGMWGEHNRGSGPRG